MTAKKKTGFPGVRFKEFPSRKRAGLYEKYYSIRYQRHVRSIEEGVGWGTGTGRKAVGITPQYCSGIRTEIINNIRGGSGFQSYQEKRENEEAARQTELAEHQAKKKKNIPFNTLAIKFLEWSQDNRASWKDDESRYRNHIKSVLGDIPIRDIGILHLERLKKKIKDKGRSPQTTLHCLSLVRSMLYSATDLGLQGGSNPFIKISKDKKKKKFLKIPDASRLNWFSHEQANLLLNELQASSPQLHDISLLSLHSGLRAGEIFSLIWADVDIQNEIITVRNPKNDEMRRAHMTPQVKARFQRRKPDNARLNTLVFTNRKGKKIREVSNTFNKATVNLRFNEGITDRRDKLVFHSLRHTYGSWLAAQGTPLLTIMELMGHKDMRMTMKYSHLLEDHKKDAVLQLAENQARKVVKLTKKRKQK